MLKILALFVLAISLPLAAEAKMDRPCKKVMAACEAAGFKKGGHKEGKGLMMDCMKKLMDGEKVEGVTVAAEDMAACKEMHEKRMKNHMGDHMGKTKGDKQVHVAP